MLWLFCFVLLLLQPAGVQADALVVTFRDAPSPTLWKELQKELRGSPIDGRLWEVERPVENGPRLADNERLVVVELQGSCRLPEQNIRWRPDPLGWVEIVDGQWIPFVHVDCRRVAEAVRRDLAAEDVFGETRLARALAVVIRHELRHLLAQKRTHDESGEFRARLLARRDLF